MKTAGYFLFIFMTVYIQSLFAQQTAESPSWTKDLIIYEISPKGFTSPNGPETGTFNSLKEKIPYLHDLGINAVWLSGHSWGDPKHFYNIWTQYACIRPDSIEPTLGTPKDLKDLVDEFHRNGIKVFLDIITHGVMSYSPLIMEKPLWFKGGSWNMTDYDWYGGHKDLDDWWVDTHTKYVTEYGVDGFRLDTDIYRPDLWHKIKENAEKAGHPIVVFAEDEFFTDNVSDFYQKLVRVQESPELTRDAASFLNEVAVRSRTFAIESVTVTYTDGTEDSSDTMKGEKLSFRTEKAGQSTMKITVKNIDANKAIKKIIAIPSPYSALYNYKIPYIMEASEIPKTQALTITGLSEITMEITPFQLDREYLANELSSHDRGWDGFPLDRNPYLVQGSRCIFGYSFLFTPAILFFMSGEEFDADYVPLPTHSPRLFKKEEAGKGRWLYGSWIQWDQLNQQKHRDMLADVKKMIAIRTQEKDVIHSVLNDVNPNIAAVEYRSSDSVPVPYILWNDKKAILVAGNYHTDKDVELTVMLPFEKTGIPRTSRIRITDLWNGGNEIKKITDTTNFTFRIKKDKIKGGGIAVFKIETLP